MADTPEAALQTLPEALARPVRLALQDLQWSEGLPLPNDLARVWALSTFVRQSCLRAPELLEDLIREGRLEKPATAEDYGQACRSLLEAHADDDKAMMAALRYLRRREMVRIAWRDLSGQATLEETLRETSWLADACIEAAEQWSRAVLVSRHGVPRDAEGAEQRLVVLGMGKLGGEELNFSSDIDLIMAYPAPGETDGQRPLDNQQFFTRQGQLLIRLLNEPTAEGFVFRVDMRLRPFGDSGPLVQHFEAMESYYLQHGREWERYAMVKARVVAGDRNQGETLLETLRPFVFRRYLDYHTFHELRSLKAQIDLQARRKGREDDLKVGPGGIREIEFIVQAFQILRGGREPKLRERHLLSVLPRLAELEILPRQTVEGLEHAYRFLRAAENHVQMLADEQRHSLPPPGEDRLRVALAQGFDDEAAFTAELERVRGFVRERFAEVFGGAREEGGDDESGARVLALLDGELDEDELGRWLEESGYPQPGEVAGRVLALARSSRLKVLGRNGRRHLTRLLPTLLKEAASQ
ncbi:MAG: bifunctional [glutamate--ammonia ligase]-adenylyl-L-tyrosine phosphorylase/[glutamate--ammonia-ligase] adenylyltransferase, partial [Gammaproteobacteria bacterium]